MRLWIWNPCPFRQRSFHYNGVAWVCANLYFVDLKTTYFEHLLLSNAFWCSDKAAKDIYLVKPLNLVHTGLLICVMGFSEMQKLEYWHWVRHEHNKMYLSAEKKLNVASICSFRERQFSRSGFVGQSCKYTGTTSSTWCIREGTKQSRGTKSKWNKAIYLWDPSKWSKFFSSPSTWWVSTPPWWRTGRWWAWPAWCCRSWWSPGSGPSTSPGRSTRCSFDTDNVSFIL